MPYSAQCKIARTFIWDRSQVQILKSWYWQRFSEKTKILFYRFYRLYLGHPWPSHTTSKQGSLVYEIKYGIGKDIFHGIVVIMACILIFFINLFLDMYHITIPFLASVLLTSAVILPKIFCFLVCLIWQNNSNFEQCF